MSSSLVKKALALFEETPAGKKTNSKGLKKLGLPLSKKAKKQNPIFHRNTLKDQKVKSAVEEYKRKQLADQTEHNLKLLGVLSSKKTEAPVMKKILNKVSKAEVREETPEKESATVFTEEDFAWFEKSYKIR